MEIWVNPACSKCRAAVAALDDAGMEYTVRRYLEDPPDVAELDAVLRRLGLDPWHVVRDGEAAYTAVGLDVLPRDDDHRADWLAAMVADPVLIQRPIVTTDDGAAIVARDSATLGRLTGRPDPTDGEPDA